MTTATAVTPDDLLAILPEDEAHATNARLLGERLEIDEREVRDLLRALVARRDPDCVVIALPRPNGIWLGNLAELKRVRKQLISRFLKLKARINDVEFLMERLGWEPSLLDFMEGEA
jgi:hypothetical protein